MTLVNYLGASVRATPMDRIPESATLKYIYQIFEEAGLPKPAVQYVHFTRAYNAAIKGKFDGMFPLIVTEKRKEFFTFLNHPVVYSKAGLFMAEEDHYKFDGQLSSLKKLKLITLQNASYGPIDPILAEMNDNIIRLTSILTMPKLIINNRADGFIAEWSIGEGLIKTQKLDHRIKVYKKPLAYISQTIAFNKKSLSPATQKKLEEAILRLKAKGITAPIK